MEFYPRRPPPLYVAFWAQARDFWAYHGDIGHLKLLNSLIDRALFTYGGRRKCHQWVDEDEDNNGKDSDNDP
jgi:hypothetical protein